MLEVWEDAAWAVGSEQVLSAPAVLTHVIVIHEQQFQLSTVLF